MQLETSPDFSPFTEAGFRTLARRTLHVEPPELTRADARRPASFALNSGPQSEIGWKALERPAAVLVPVVARPELTLLFTLRTDHLPAHAGQIAFPGGKVEEGDAGPVETALREAKEEIGLDPACVETLGFLDSYRTGTGYRIMPVVAVIHAGFSLALNMQEVVEAFEVPLSFLMDARNHQRHARVVGGRERAFDAMPYGERFIWGATAGILRNMHERLFGS